MNKFTVLIIIVIVFLLGSCNEKTGKVKLQKSPAIVTNKVIVNDSTKKNLPQSVKEEVNDLTENIKDFIPENYSVLDAVSGNLNLDSYNDMILVLKKNHEEKTSDVIENPEKRPLLILIGAPNDKYKLVERNDKSVYCIDCGGMMGDPYTGITIKKGFFSVEHYGGSAWRWTRIITYKYSKEHNNWFLQQDGGESFNAGDHKKVEKTIKTTKDFGKVLFKDFDIYAEEIE
ncbi:hypothetical protein [Flavobacterium algicola]|uniref:hypothetical protein n=1 Tax=Flavobacterium algicola TaxID=556529 RepID=UPI001EFD6B51|nr:hypothetical protein [Flavobacterium algicola]MCG9793256.1 hypothetical protein [Flavobacterium algicola]